MMLGTGLVWAALTRLGVLALVVSGGGSVSTFADVGGTVTVDEVGGAISVEVCSVLLISIFLSSEFFFCRLVQR